MATVKNDRNSKSTNATDATPTTPITPTAPSAPSGPSAPSDPSALSGCSAACPDVGLAYHPTLVERTLIRAFKGVNKFISWDKLPRYIGIFNLLAFRLELRAKNLYDVYPSVAWQGTPQTVPMPPNHEWVRAMNPEGKFNDLQEPLMGCAGMRFGRNVPRKDTAAPSEEELLSPNPRLVSDRLMRRAADGGFKPATIVNLLAAAWVQFQVHDWFFHYQSEEEAIEVPIPEGDTWPSGHMRIPRTQRDVPLDECDRKSPAYRNEYTAWWDGSQIYGNNEEQEREVRGGCDLGKLKLDEKNGMPFLPRNDQGLPITGSNVNWWIGLELMHTLFSLEHNAICDMLHAKYPDFSNDQLFQTARLVNTALMAKIHTVEWTPAILAHPTIKVALDSNWWGLVGEKITKTFGRVSKTSEIISGIPGSGVYNDSIPYSMTEEFVSVYRMHALVPDNIAFFSLPTGAHTATIPISSLTFTNALNPLIENASPHTLSDAFYSFAINYPGAITHHNYSDYMRFLQLPVTSGDVPGTRDVATVDILRDRERGVPRYCRFRRLFHMPVPRTYLELTGGDATLASQLASVYGPESEGGLDKVDLLVGCLCEPLPKGFGFSDTAFRVFILMASRRLKSDRFIAGSGWDKKYYTKEGMRWVQDNTMRDVLLRHFPELAPGLKGNKNPFAPWRKVGKAKEYGGEETNVPEKLKRAAMSGGGKERGREKQREKGLKGWVKHKWRYGL